MTGISMSQFSLCSYDMDCYAAVLSHRFFWIKFLTMANQLHPGNINQLLKLTGSGIDIFVCIPSCVMMDVLVINFCIRALLYKVCNNDVSVNSAMLFLDRTAAHSAPMFRLTLVWERSW